MDCLLKRYCIKKWHKVQGTFSDFHSCVIRLCIMPCVNAQNTRSIKSCGNEECDKCRSVKCVGIESGWAVQIIFV